MFRLYFKAVNLLRALITGLKYVVVVKFTNLTKVQNWALPLLSLCRWKSQKMQKKNRTKIENASNYASLSAKYFTMNGMSTDLGFSSGSCSALSHTN